METTCVSRDDREYIVDRRLLSGDIIGGAERATRLKGNCIEVITESISDAEWDARMKNAEQ